MAHIKAPSSASMCDSSFSSVLPAPATSTSQMSVQSSLNGSATELPADSPIESLVDSSSSVSSPGVAREEGPAKLLEVPLHENMTNPKEKTPMCLVNELARFNRIQPQYKLLDERGPAHCKLFTVQLTLGDQTWEAESTSIKKAQHAAASLALSETRLPKPAPRQTKNILNNNPKAAHLHRIKYSSARLSAKGSITPTVELNGLAMKRGEPAIYRPLDPKPLPNHRTNYNYRGMYNQRYLCPMLKTFYVQLTVGNTEFYGEGKTRQAARHNAALKALHALKNEPIPERSSVNGETRSPDEDKDANKSEISLVFEISLKRNLPLSFEVTKESGPPHMKSFVTKVTVGEFTAEGEGNSKKLAKRRAAAAVLQELRKLPPLPVIERPRLYIKRRPKTIIKASPEYGQGMNPISRLAQIQQAKKEKEPEYVLLSERGIQRRREFIMQVKVGEETATGTGPNKKTAKRNAAEAMLLQLGYKASTPVAESAAKQGDQAWADQGSGASDQSSTPKGILHLSPDVYQEMEASRSKTVSTPPAVNYLSPKELNQTSSSYFSTSVTQSCTSAVARELLTNGSSPAAESVGFSGNNLTSSSSTVQPSKQLEYLAGIQGLQVNYSDRQNGNEFFTCLTLLPVQMTFHGIGNSVETSHDQAALSALKQFSEQGLDSVEGSLMKENGPFEQAKHRGEKADNTQANSGTSAQDCKDSKAVV
ncbi:double-stranded RNA-binding protein Staufen homolog 2 isoform X1 [Bufo bufo]|uniref:double-stranded RNA-binding protein Staufen homolog 2 isoform X1 n=1 Tax=Bufo bufo TaxID=8384 RepID=UPI001ABDB850|nr:double-stranded RNA-binding protein Staufen homolog 2 isoform X1 [Bufo bufo]XP_040287927.1 double-stranded RNA-binding protein Staufen homolog 2 isoform X1 [Bufo bufo]